MHFSTMSEWLEWITSIHNSEIELGLDRVKQVAERLNLLSPSCPIIMVGGTNGKGSCVAALENIYRSGGYHVGTFTSPYLFKHNEQVRIDGSDASDTEFCQAFEKVESARKNTSLTQFEYHTLAALMIFQQHKLDILILEIGLGGRLDAVNILDADVAIVSSIGIDHVDWLGKTREEIGFEKAGIFRANRAGVCGDCNPPNSLIEHAKKMGALLYIQGKDFFYQQESAEWQWHFEKIHYDHLPLNALATQNMSTVLMAITLLQNLLPVSTETICKGLTRTFLPGRIQVFHDVVTKIFDVAHNPDAIEYLYTRLRDIPCHGETIAVFSMLADKDISESIKQIKSSIDVWHVAPLQSNRAAGLKQILNAFELNEIQNVTSFSTIKEAYQAAVQLAHPGDRIVIFGSFHTVAEALRAREENKS